MRKGKYQTGCSIGASVTQIENERLSAGRDGIAVLMRMMIKRFWYTTVHHIHCALRKYCYYPDAREGLRKHTQNTSSDPGELRFHLISSKISFVSFVSMGKSIFVNRSFTCACVKRTRRFRRCASGNCIGFESLTLHAPRPPMFGM